MSTHDISDFDVSIVFKRTDGSYVINNGTYHVPNEGDWEELYEQVDQYAKEHPEIVQPDPSELPPTDEEVEAQLTKYYTDLIQKYLDSKAKELGYDSCLSVCSYIDTGVQKFDDEGKAFRAWRSAVWARGYELIDEVKAGLRDIPSEDELFSLLPELVITYSAE